MAEVNQTNGINSDYYYENRPKREPVKELDKNAFLQIMIAQLKYQDPTSPMDTNKFVEQMAQFTMMEQITNLNTSFNKLYSLQQISYGFSLIGHEVTVVSGENNGELVTGKVQKVTMSSDRVLVWLGDDNGQALKAYDLQQVIAVTRRATDGTEELLQSLINNAQPATDSSTGSEDGTSGETEPTTEAKPVGEE